MHIKGLFPAITVGIVAVLQLNCETDVLTASPPGLISGNCIGTIKDAEGKPVYGASVVLVPQGYTPLSMGGDNTKLDSTISDEYGRFGFSVQQSGAFNILAESKNRFGLHSTVYVNAHARTESNAIIKEPGSLSGTVHLQGMTNQSAVAILFIGTHLYTEPSDSTGSFSVSALAEGNYNIRIVAIVPGFAPVETTVTVNSGHHSQLPIIMLSKKKVFAVDSLIVNYDPLFMRTTLRWNPLDTSLVDRYVIYLNRETNFQPIETVCKNVSKTIFYLFPDSTSTFTYQIAAIDNKGHEGPAAIGRSFVKTCATSRSETIPANKLDPKYKASAGIDFMKNYSDDAGSNVLLGNYFLYSNNGLDSNGNTYMKIYIDSSSSGSKPGVNYSVNLVRFNTNMQPVKKMYLYNNTTPSLAKTVVAQNGTIYNIIRNFRNDNPNDLEFNVSEYDSNFVLIKNYVTTEKVYIEHLSNSYSRWRPFNDEDGVYIDSVYRNFKNKINNLDFLDDFLSSGIIHNDGFILGPGGLFLATCSSQTNIIDSTMFLLLTIEKKVLARMPLNLAGNIFFDNSGNLCQSLYNETGEVNSIAVYSTTQLLNGR
jgi:hypothetical protein